VRYGEIHLIRHAVLDTASPDATEDAEIKADSESDDADLLLRNRRVNANYNISVAEVQATEVVLTKAFVDVHKDTINKEYIRTMIDYDKIKDEELIKNLQSEDNSDFWLDQDVLYIREIGDSFRRLII